MHGHGLSRLSNGVSSVTSPPTSPRHRGNRTKPTPTLVDDDWGFQNTTNNRNYVKNVLERLLYFIISAVYRRRGVLLFAPLLYISGMLLYMGTFGFDVINDVVVVKGDVTGPGSVYRSPQLFNNLWPFMEGGENTRGGGSNMLTNVWNPKLHQGWKPCTKKTVKQSGSSELPKSNGFLIIEANGGLNQQRLSICDAVAVAGLLNATLVIPIFHLNSVWKDSSKFRDIFDEEFFIYALKNHVNVVRELPEDVLQKFDNNISNIVNLRVKGWSSANHYLEKVLPKLIELKYDFKPLSKTTFLVNKCL